MILAACVATVLAFWNADPPVSPAPPVAPPPAPSGAPREIEAPTPTRPSTPGDPTRRSAPRPNALTPQQTPAQPQLPPFVPSVGATMHPAAGADGLPTPYFAGATQWVIDPGTSWRAFAEKIKPGDEILFRKGFHIPQDFVGLSGTQERPIFIRSRDQIPAAIVCEEHGFVFKRASHIVVENLFFLNAIESAVLIDGSPVEGAAVESPLGQPEPGGWKTDLLLRNCSIMGTRKNPEHDAVHIRASEGVRVDSVRVDGWNDAAVEIDGGHRVLIRGLMMVPTEKYTQRRGIAVIGASSDISLTVCSFNDGIQTGVDVGTPGLPGPNGVPAVPPVERMRVDRCVFLNGGTALNIANARDLTVSRITVVNPARAIYAIPDDAGVVERVLIEKSLASWPPGSLAKFSPHPDRISPNGITLGDNLWHSAELPIAFELLGAPFGYQAAAQITNVDPFIDIKSLRPLSADAVRYGVFSIATVTQPPPSPPPVAAPDPPTRAAPAPNPQAPPAPAAEKPPSKA